jgi:hypothetical protein
MSKHRAAPHDHQDPHRASAEHEAQLMRPDGHRYEAPESRDEQFSKSWAYAGLALVVVLLMVLMATGAVPIFPR